MNIKSHTEEQFAFWNGAPFQQSLHWEGDTLILGHGERQQHFEVSPRDGDVLFTGRGGTLRLSEPNEQAIMLLACELQVKAMPEPFTERLIQQGFTVTQAHFYGESYCEMMGDFDRFELTLYQAERGQQTHWFVKYELFEVPEEQNMTFFRINLGEPNVIKIQPDAPFL